MWKFTNVATRLISFGGVLVLTGACVLAALNILIVIFNSFTSSRYPLVIEFSYSGHLCLVYLLYDFQNTFQRILLGGLKKREATFGGVRKQLGEATALGLEILVVADIMESLSRHIDSFSWDMLGKMVINIKSIYSSLCRDSIVVYMYGI